MEMRQETGHTRGVSNGPDQTLKLPESDPLIFVLDAVKSNPNPN